MRTARKAKSAPHSQHRVRARSSAESGRRDGPPAAGVVAAGVAGVEEGASKAGEPGGKCPFRKSSASGAESCLIFS
jgi:hypothetical protein